MNRLSALVGSRICHDLINPLGAIGNGLELLEMSGSAGGAEMALVSESVDGAIAKVRFMRIAFGDAAPDQTISRQEILSVLTAIAHGGRMSYSWDVPHDTNRRIARLALLCVMCMETALPLGGDIEITSDGEHWTIRTQHERLNLDPALWGPLSKGECPADLIPAQVQFGLAPDMAAQADRVLSFDHGADWVQITF